MTASVPARCPEVLLVEDDPGDVAMTSEAFEEAGYQVHLNVVSDGEQAVAYLRRQGDHALSPRPDLVLLDLNLPRMSGHEVLAEIKNDPDLLRIPVVVLTTSQSPDDIMSSYQLHVNAYVPKPTGVEQFEKAIREIGHFFTERAKLPPR